MIYTVTINPSIDYYMYLDSFVVGKTNRSSSELSLFGGKGFNVSKMLNVMGQDNFAFGFTAGETGKMFESLLKESNIRYKLFDIESGSTRINVKVKEHIETEINAAGPRVPEEKISELLYELRRLEKGDVLIVSGSIAKNNEDNLYKRIIGSLKEGVLTVVDTSGRPLLFSLHSKPFLIKPNFFELEQVYGKPIKNDDELIKAMRSLQVAGARNVLVSLGRQGACLLTDNNKMYLACSKGEPVINSVGAGDCLIAGFIATYLKTKDYRMSLISGVACGSAKAYSKDLPNKLKVKEVLMNTTTKTIF